MSSLVSPSIGIKKPREAAPLSSSLSRGNNTKKTVLKQHYVTPAEVSMPVAHPQHQLAHFAIPINQITAQSSAQAHVLINGQEVARKTEIDGFYLLEAAKLSFPEDLQQIVLCDRKLQTVIDEDLPYFTGLLYVDVSENFLPLLPFGALPQLRELRMACNRIQSIGDLMGFDKLLYLDLSYNSLTPMAVEQLLVLSMLKELDLSGNHLKQLPADMSNMLSLEKFVLEYNKLDDNNVFMAFSSLPNLRYLDLSHNYLSAIPSAACDDTGLKLLETLDLAFNYFSREVDLHAILVMPRLTRLLLYGNPVLGPTGEDPLFTYIEDLVEQSQQVREDAKSQIPDVEFVTEIPRRRILKKGQPLGRFALYRDFSMVQVDEQHEATARQWRQQGAQTLFGEAQQARKTMGNSTATAGLSQTSSAPDFTFITNSIAAANLQPQPSTSTSTSAPIGGAGIGTMDIDAIADDVMQKVAQEMGLLDETELNVFRQYTTLPLTVLERQALGEDTDALEEELDDDASDGQSRGSASASTGRSSPFSRGGMGAQMPDRVPQQLFASNINNMPQLHAQPVALKTAMKALQQAISQPLTDYNEVPSSWSLSGRDHARHTSTSKLRQLPRIPIDSKTDEDSGKWDNRSKRFHRRGLAEPPALQRQRQETRERTLEQIDMVLTQLNDHTGRLAGAQQSAPGEVTEGVGHVRQNMEQMRSFARPRAGVKKLMNMVHSIVEEFNT